VRDPVDRLDSMFELISCNVITIEGRLNADTAANGLSPTSNGMRTRLYDSTVKGESEDA